MKIDFNAVDELSSTLQSINVELLALKETGGPVISHGFSQVAGVSEAGGIHGRAMQVDPASASETLSKLQGQVEWLNEALATHADAFDQQESDNGRAMDIADAGGVVEIASMPVVEQPEPGYSPFSFTEPVVSVGPSLDILAAQLNGSDIQSGAATAQRWRDLAGQVTQISEQLDFVASGLLSKNDSEATERAAAKIREVSATADQFAANSRIMAKKVVTLGRGVALAGFDAMLKSATVNAMTDPRERKAAEAAALFELQSKLQSTVAASMPMQASLIDDYAATGGGDLETGVGEIAGDGRRYSTDGVRWPEKLVSKAMNGTLGPGDFQMVKQAAQELGGVGNEAALDEAVRNAVHAPKAALPQDQGLAPLGDGAGGALGRFNLPAADVGTQSATTAGLAPQNTAAAIGGAGSPTSAGAGLATAPSPSTNGFGMAPLTANNARTQASGLHVGSRPFGGPNSMNGVSGLNGPAGSLMGARRGGAGAAGAGFGTGIGPGTGFGATTGGFAGGGAVRGGAGTAVPGAPSAGGVKLGAPGAGVPGPGTPGSGTPVAGANRTGGAHAASSSAGSRTGGGARGVMPMMGARGAEGAKGKKVKSVVTQVELEPNKKALLGESPLVVPGVIGAWVRD